MSKHHPFRILRRFRKDEDGSQVIDFAIMLPLFIMAMMSSVELGFVSIKHMMLERALALTVREIRLGTGSAPQHNDIKDKICARAPMLDNCENNLRLEMVKLNLRTWANPPATVDCIDHSEDVKPVREFTSGNVNDLMLLRACALFKPILPGSGLGKALDKDGAGYAALVAQSACVQEPK